MTTNFLPYASTDSELNENELTALIRNYNIPPQPHILAEIQNTDDDVYY